MTPEADRPRPPTPLDVIHSDLDSSAIAPTIGDDRLQDALAFA